MINSTAKRSKGSAQPRKITDDRITIEALKYYVPLFHKGDEASKRILEEDVSPQERNSLETRLQLRDHAVKKLTSLCDPLITRELQKIISTSHLAKREDLFDMLYYAGIDGMIKGLRHFDVDKINKSSTNYIFQWITTYAKRELTVLEAPYGIAPSRFKKYKKISAVRKKLSHDLGRYAENEEVLEYFHSGKADVKTLNGRVSDSGKPSQANLNMTLESVIEQEEFEKNLNYTTLIDPSEDYSFNAEFSEKDTNPFFETLFGSFVSSYNFKDEAVAVLMSNLKESMKDEYSDIIVAMDEKNYRKISNSWSALFTDIDGPFYSFLVGIDDTTAFTEVDVIAIIKNIEKSSKNIRQDRWINLFEDKNIERRI